MSSAADAVWIMSNKMTLNVRGSYYNMVDEFYNPSLELGQDGLAGYWPTPWYSSLYNSGYTYYPALDVTTGTGTATTNRLGRQGREWYQHPDAWTASARMNYYMGNHNMKWGGEMRSYFGEAARFEPINLVFNSALTANSSDTPDVTGSGNQWATFMLGALDSQTSARLVPLQEPDLKSYAAYIQDDWNVNDRLTLNLGLRWEYEPGATDPLNRISQRLDLTSPIPEMQATPPPIPAQASQLMASKGYAYSYTGEWVFASESNPYAWSTSALNFMPRLGAAFRLDDKSVVRAGYARFLMPITNVRDTLGDFVNQYTGYAQTTTTLGLANGVPQQTLANPYPANNPVIEPYGQNYGRYTGLGGAVSLDQYQLRPQVNDRFNFSFQREVWAKTVVEANYFLNLGSRVPYDVNLNMPDPAFRYEQKTAAQHAGRQPVPQLPDARQVPRPVAQHRHRHAGQPAGAVSAVRHDHADQHQRQAPQHADRRTAGAASVHQRLQRAGGVCLEPRAGAAVVRRHRQLPGAADQRRGGLGMAADRHAGASASRPPSPGRSRWARARRLAPTGTPRSTPCSATGSTPPRAASIRAGRCSSTPATSSPAIRR